MGSVLIASDRSSQEIRATDRRFKRSVPQCNQLRKIGV